MNEKNNSNPLIYVHAGYRNLKSFQIAQLVYDVTVRFCNRYIGKRSRTHDRMAHGAAQVKNGLYGPDGRYDEISANAALVLIGVTCRLPDRQINSLADRFEKKAASQKNCITSVLKSGEIMISDSSFIASIMSIQSINVH